MNYSNFLNSTQISWFTFKPQNFPSLEQKLTLSEYKRYIRIIEDMLFWRNLFLTNKKLYNLSTITGSRNIVTDIELTLKKIKKHLQLSTEQLLEISCDINQPYLADALLDSHLKKGKWLFNFNHNSLKFCLLNAVRNNEPLLLQKLIDAKADYNHYQPGQQSPLAVAIQLDRTFLVEILIKSGAISHAQVQHDLSKIDFEKNPKILTLISSTKPVSDRKRRILPLNPLYHSIRTFNLKKFYSLRIQGAVSSAYLRKEVQNKQKHFLNNPGKLVILEEMGCVLDEDNVSEG